MVTKPAQVSFDGVRQQPGSLLVSGTWEPSQYSTCALHEQQNRPTKAIRPSKAGVIALQVVHLEVGPQLDKQNDTHYILHRRGLQW